MQRGKTHVNVTIQPDILITKKGVTSTLKKKKMEGLISQLNSTKITFYLTYLPPPLQFFWLLLREVMGFFLNKKPHAANQVNKRILNIL